MTSWARIYTPISLHLKLTTSRTLLPLLPPHAPYFPLLPLAPPLLPPPQKKRVERPVYYYSNEFQAPITFPLL